MEKKMTYVNAIDMALEGNLTEEVVEKLEALKVSLAKRNAHKSDKPTKAQVANEGVKDAIMEFLADGEAHQCKAVAEALGISPQKASALLSQLVKAEKVEKFAEKRVSFFKAVEA